MNTARHHTISYIELGVTDLAATKTFYGKAFGWKCTDHGPGYSGTKTPDGKSEVGGLNPGLDPSGDRLGVGADK